MNYKITKGDSNYSHALNYDGTNYYNNPCTIDIEGKLYIIGAGTSDSIRIIFEGPLCYVITNNSGLGYASLECINTEDDSKEQCYIDNIDDLSSDFFSLDPCIQLQELKNYLPY